MPFTANPCGAERLHESYLALLVAAPFDAAGPRQLFFSDPWYHSELRRIATALVGRRAAWRGRVDDLVHDALLLMARNLERRPDLGFDHGRPTDEFACRLRSIIRNHLLQALRRERRQMPPQADFENHVDTDRRVVTAARVRRRERQLARDAIELLDALPEPISGVLKLHFDQVPSGTISQRLGFSRWRVRQMIAAGMAEIRNAMR
jgi:RNA polymerase sigma factor (sigma-70 family)